MALNLDDAAVAAVFSLPSNDGRFDADFRDYLQELGELRKSVVLAFAPKAAGTYLRSAAIVAIQGALVRTVHAQGGRDASFYLPTLLSYFLGGLSERTLVTHVHMQALPANRFLIEALDLKPVIMIRPVPDMLASYLDMLKMYPMSADNWLNVSVPEGYASLTDDQKADFVVEMMGPWYASYFSTWLDYAALAPRRICILSYDEFKDDPVDTLSKLLAHSGLPRSHETCAVALDTVWTERYQFRFNKGVPGRGNDRFSAVQLERLERQINFYPNLRPWKAQLFPPR